MRLLKTGAAIGAAWTLLVTGAPAAYTFEVPPVLKATESPRGQGVPADQDWMAGIKARLQASEFEFSRADSAAPFVPVASFSATAYGKTKFQRADGSGAQVEFRSSCVGAYAMVPLYAGRRGLAVAVPYASHTRFNSMTDGLGDKDVDSLYLPVGGAWQADSGRQWGGFVMPTFNSPLAGDGDWATDFMGGALGRSFAGGNAIWYYGLIYDYSFGGNVFYPYLGYTYQFDPHWILNLVAPWPSLTYAPTDRFFVGAGFVPSGASWKLDQEGQDAQATGSFGGWDLGAYGGWRLSKLLWFGMSAGFSGLRSLQVNQEGETVFEQRLSREPFVSVSLTVRPKHEEGGRP